MAKIANFRELVVWQKGMDLAEQIHRAEGFHRRSRGAYRAHVAIALGSNAEVQTFLELCRRLALIEQSAIGELVSLSEEIGRLLYGLWRSLFVAAVCYSLTLLAVVSGLPWLAARILIL